MITVNRVNDFITGTVNGKSYSVPFNDEKFDRMKQVMRAAEAAQNFDELKQAIDQFMPMTQDSFKETVEHKTPYLHVNPSTGEYYLSTADGVLTKYPLPGAFVQRIVRAVETGNELEPTIKCIVRFMKNPNYSYAKCLRFANYLNRTHVDKELVANLTSNGVSQDKARERATLFQTTMTREGLINTYKVSTEVDWKMVDDGNGGVKKVDRHEYEIDEITGLKTYKVPEFVEDRIFMPAVMGTGGDAFFCGDKKGHIIKVGQEHFLESWDQVDCNDGISCRPGLHVGNLDYIAGYQREDTVTHNIFVDPMFIGAITDDGTGALRVLRYFVHSSFAGINRNYYHSSKYAAITDGLFEKMVEEAVEITNKEKEASVTAATERIAQLELLRTF